MYCDPSLELSQRDGSNDGSQYIFMEKYGELSLNFLSKQKLFLNSNLTLIFSPISI